MPRRKSNTTDAASAAVDTGVEDTVNTEATTAAEDATTSDPFFARFVVAAGLSENADAAEFHGADVVNFIVTRWKKADYTAQCIVGTGEDASTFKGKQSRNPSKAIRNTIAAMSQREKEYIFDAEAAEAEQAPMPEKAGDNNPPSYFFEDETTDAGAALAKVASRMAEVEELYTSADASTRAGEIGIGTVYNEAKAIFAAEGFTVTGERSDNEAVKASNKAWGEWLTKRAASMPHVFDVLSTPGKRSRCGFYASAPEEVVNSMPTVNTATTFERKVNEAVSGVATAKDRPGFAPRVAERLFAAKSADADDEAVTASTRDMWEAAVMLHEANLERVAKARTAWEAAVKKATEAGNPSPAFADRLAEVENLIIGWLLGDVSPTDEDGRTARAAAFEGSKLHLAIKSAWDAEVNKPTAEEAEEAEQEEQKKRAKEATKEASKGIALMTVSEAAEVVANTVMAHPEPTAVAEALLEVVKARLEAKAKADAEAAAKAEDEANKAA